MIALVNAGDLGKFECVWNSLLQLKEIRWLSDTSSSQAKPGFSSPTHPEQLALSSDFWNEWLASFQNFLIHGDPVKEVEWENIDRSDWSDFQVQTYAALRKIPFGETRSYAWIASKMGNFAACRAVGQALRRNPIPVLIPCHRVVSAQGGLGGFMGKSGSDDREVFLKQKLIALEDRYRNPLFSFLGSTSLTQEEQPGLNFGTSEVQIA